MFCPLIGSDQKPNIDQQEIASLISKPFQTMTHYSIKQLNYSHAIAFNMEQTIMLGACDCVINVFEFEQGQLNLKQLLRNNQTCINTLYFMAKQNKFISGTYQDIAIWGYNNLLKLYYCLQFVKLAHFKYINRVIMNNTEDLIISCSDDKTIKFWIQKNEWKLQQTLIYHKNDVYDININESSTQLISCDYEGSIIISQQGDGQKWRKIQRIQSNYGFRICYINENMIAFQPKNATNLEIYQLNKLKKQFIKYKDVSVQNDDCCAYWFPMQFNNKKSLLLHKNGCRINLIRYKNDDFIIEQSINLGTHYIWGAMTEDFQYLVTWDQLSQEFQVRKQK